MNTAGWIAKSWALASVMALALGVVRGAEDEVPFWEIDLESLPQVEASLASKARELGLPVDGIEIGEQRLASEDGDKIAFLVDYFNGRESEQSILGLTWAGLDASEKPVKIKRYCSSGDVFEITSGKAKMRSQLIGSLGDRSEPTFETIDDEISIMTASLAAGFDTFARLGLKLKEKKINDPSLPRFWFYTRNSPPVEKDVAKAQQALFDQYGVTFSEMTGSISFGFAFEEYLGIFNDTHGVSEILWQVAEKPSLFSLMTKGLSVNAHTKSMGIVEVDPKIWGLSEGQECYRIPYVLNLNGKDALNVTMFVTTPEIPLAQAAGVVGLIATPVNRESNKTVTIRIVGSSLSKT